MEALNLAFYWALYAGTAYPTCAIPDRVISPPNGEDHNFHSSPLVNQNYSGMIVAHHCSSKRENSYYAFNHNNQRRVTQKQLQYSIETLISNNANPIAKLIHTSVGRMPSQVLKPW